TGVTRRHARSRDAWLGRAGTPRLNRAVLFARGLVGDERRHVLLEYRQRHRPDRENGVVKAALIEFRAELLFGLASMTADLQLAKLVGQRLSRPRDITIDFGGDLVLG